MSLPTFTPTTTAEEVAAVFAAQIRGKNMLVTGTSINGIGFETARVIAKHANLVIVTGYNSERLRLTEEAIKKEVPGANVRPLVLDLTSLAAVRKAAAEVNAYAEPLHVLIHNAAAGGGPFKLTADGIETQLATAQFGPFLFTKLLAPKLLATGSESFTPRVVFVSSAAHAFGGVDLSTIADPDPAKFNSSAAYFEAKAANILFASELSKRSQGKINAYSLHPGVIFTNISQKEGNKADLTNMGILNTDGSPNTEKFTWKSIPQGAATTLAAAFDTRLDTHPGAYLSDAVVANDQIAPHASDPETAAKLWTISEEIVGEKFAF
ncbi:NAD-P-binding protein [Mycena albidolilacea]|uniref:NAD-P-binding protein n=1 Tax=Mycena albidolilacea TaxID=1033008 RepID=A0AAD6Z9R9_9AGAR|nr:NAD-P-binding protein [Mycena albidolilacea]